MGKRTGNELSTITSSELSSVIYSPLAETLENPFSKEIFLIYVRVAGLKYRENINELLKNLKVGDKVILAREPENEYDDLAIKIQDAENRKIGYVPRVNNEILARLLDAGFKLFGRITEIKDPIDGEYPWNAVWVDLFLEEGGSELLYLSSKQLKSPGDEFHKQLKSPGDEFYSEISGLLHTTLSEGIHKPFSREIFLANFPAMGSFKIEKLNRVLCKMKVGDRVMLRREMDYANDENAIVIMNKRKRKLGYVPRSHNIILARLMDAGKHIYGVATKIDYEKNGVGSINAIVIDVFMED